MRNDAIIQNLAPSALWNYFIQLSKIPRPSQREQKAGQFVQNVGLSLELETTMDKAGNVIIKKPATKGMESACTVALQAHLDMVYQKRMGLEFDFNKDPIPVYLDGDWIKAAGTTLGADNGIGVAAILAILSTSDLSHPPLEALFTVDEELGMTGVAALKGDELEAKILLNLDEEIDNVLTIGCAGGSGLRLQGSCQSVEAKSGTTSTQISISGLLGGHSGDEIHLGRINSIKLLAEFLRTLRERTEFAVHSISGGNLPNVIPTEAKAVLTIPRQNITTFSSIFDGLKAEIEKRLKTIEPNLVITSSVHDPVNETFVPQFLKNCLQAILDCPHGVFRMNPRLPEQVQSSNNLASVTFTPAEYTIDCTTRSSYAPDFKTIHAEIVDAFIPLEPKLEHTASYPAWQPEPESDICRLMHKVYSDLFNQQPQVTDIHAGLECGVLSQRFPEMQLISFGPNIKRPHTPEEQVQVSSVQKFWRLLLVTLEQIGRLP